MQRAPIEKKNELKHLKFDCTSGTTTRFYISTHTFDCNIDVDVSHHPVIQLSPKKLRLNFNKNVDAFKMKSSIFILHSGVHFFPLTFFFVFFLLLLLFVSFSLQ